MLERVSSGRSSNTKPSCNKTELNRNCRNVLKQKGSFSVITRTAGNPATKVVGKKLASIAVHGAERLQGNWLEAIFAFQLLLLLLLLLLLTTSIIMLALSQDHLTVSSHAITYRVARKKTGPPSHCKYSEIP